MKKYENGKFVIMTNEEIELFNNAIKNIIPEENKLEELAAYIEAIKPILEKVKILL